MQETKHRGCWTNYPRPMSLFKIRNDFIELFSYMEEDSSQSFRCLFVTNFEDKVFHSTIWLSNNELSGALSYTSLEAFQPIIDGMLGVDLNSPLFFF